MWFVLALLSAVFAALTSILAKVGIDGVNSNLATAIRTAVVLIMAWGMVFITNAQHGITDIQIGDVSKVVPVDKLSVVITLILAFAFLQEKFDAKTITGAALITAGTFLMIK